MTFHSFFRSGLILILLSVSCSKNLAKQSELSIGEDVGAKIESISLSKAELLENQSKGKYLTEIAACGYCHSPDGKSNSNLSGGRKLFDDYGEISGPNITPDIKSGIGSWSAGEIKGAIRESIGKGGRLFSYNAHRYYRWLSDEDSMDIALYLQSLEPLPKLVSDSETSSKPKKRWGFADKHLLVQGYVPGLSEKSGGFRGLYLVAFLQGCARCHSPKETMPDKNDFLNGFKGKIEYVDVNEEVSVPSIRATDNGIGQWSEEKVIAHFSRSESNSTIRCPTDYYSRLDKADKKAISIYLKSLK